MSIFLLKHKFLLSKWFLVSGCLTLRYVVVFIEVSVSLVTNALMISQLYFLPQVTSIVSWIDILSSLVRWVHVHDDSPVYLNHK